MIARTISARSSDIFRPGLETILCRAAHCKPVSAHEGKAGGGEETEMPTLSQASGLSICTLAKAQRLVRDDKNAIRTAYTRRPGHMQPLMGLTVHHFPGGTKIMRDEKVGTRMSVVLSAAVVLHSPSKTLSYSYHAHYSGARSQCFPTSKSCSTKFAGPYKLVCLGGNRQICRLKVIETIC